jgi:hypothetical protein
MLQLVLCPARSNTPMKQHEQHEPESIETNDTNADRTQPLPRVRLRAESPAKSVMGDLMVAPCVRLRAT